MLNAYGPPNEAIPSRLIWYNNGKWKRTIVYRDEVPHNFPQPHSDTLEQFIDYRVPPEKFSEIAKFDGSVIIERTKGEVSSRCDMEAANILSLNMMHKIVTGEFDAEKAREVYSEQTAAYVMNRPAPYAEKFQFELLSGNTTDIDQVTIDSLTRRLLTYFDEKMEKLQLQVKVESGSNAVIRTNFILMEVLVGNLVKNAFTHNVSGGSIVIKIAVSFFEISNTGAPVPEKERIFERFYNRSSSADSWGLGLSIVKKIVDVNNWKINYEGLDGVHKLRVDF